MAFRNTTVGLSTQNNSQGYKFIIPLEADDRLAVEATIAKLFQHLARLRYAEKLLALRGPECSIADVAADTGFADQSYFGQLFRCAFYISSFLERQSSLDRLSSSPDAPENKAGLIFNNRQNTSTR